MEAATLVNTVLLVMFCGTTMFRGSGEHKDFLCVMLVVFPVVSLVVRLLTDLSLAVRLPIERVRHIITCKWSSVVELDFSWLCVLELVELVSDHLDESGSAVQLSRWNAPSQTGSSVSNGRRGSQRSHGEIGTAGREIDNCASHVETEVRICDPRRTQSVRQIPSVHRRAQRLESVVVYLRSVQ